MTDKKILTYSIVSMNSFDEIVKSMIVKNLLC